MTVPWIYSSYALLMPIQDEPANICAVIKPFQWPVS
jgi:ionotropic glutamate receptor